MQEDAQHDAYLQELAEGNFHVQDVLEDQAMTQVQQPLPNVAFIGTVNTKKRNHAELITQDICTHCAHCGLPLTDAISSERGLGPRCSSKGYLEDPKDGDEMQAMIDLAEYPELVELLTKNYKPLGVRGLMNGLVKVASLNRKHEVFSACCDAIESLGYRKLATLLRDSIAAISVSEDAKYPDFYTVWVKKAYWNYTWMREVYSIPGHRAKIYGVKGILIPKTQKRALWLALMRVYSGYVVKTAKGAYKIKSGKRQAVKV